MQGRLWFDTTLVLLFFRLDLLLPQQGVDLRNDLPAVPQQRLLSVTPRWCDRYSLQADRTQTVAMLHMQFSVLCSPSGRRFLSLRSLLALRQLRFAAHRA